MIRKVSILFILIITASFVFAQEGAMVCRCSEGEPCLVMMLSDEARAKLAESETAAKEDVSRAAKTESEADLEYISTYIPEGIRNNEYFLKSVELSQQAQEAFDSGFYDGSTALAEEAIYYARLSDRYVADQLIKEAKRLVDWADANNIEKRNPEAYEEGKTYYEASTEAQRSRRWNDAIVAAIKSIEILGQFESSRILPSQYTVRSWANHKDCLWTIAGYSFIYGDPWKWRELYNANRSRMPEPNNPNVIEPGFVLDIPSLPGETRRGMWDPNANYNK